jgi:rubredoxin
MTQQLQPFWVRCTGCQHLFAPACTPMEVGEFVRIIRRAECPSCGVGGKQLRVAKQDSGRLLEGVEP